MRAVIGQPESTYARSLLTQGNGSAPSESERTVTLLTAAECRDKAEQKMVEAMNAADPRQHYELEATAKAWLTGYRLHGLSSEVKASIDGRLIRDHQV